MNSYFFENTNEASPDYPYLSDASMNLNYFAHIHSDIELIYVVSGEIDITCENQIYTVQKNSFFILMPSEIHSFASPKQNHLYIMKIHSGNSHEKTDFSKYTMKNPLINEQNQLHSLLICPVKEIFKEYKEQKPGYSFAVNSLSQQILCILLRSEQLLKTDRETRKKQHFNMQLLEKVNEYINADYSGSITLESISKYCNYSEFYFAHIFKSITGTTFYNYLTSYRLDRAAPLLIYSDKKIIDIAAECGFSNIRSFNRAFKGFFGQTPSEYRKNGKKP